MTRTLRATLVLSSLIAVTAPHAWARELTFEERVTAQKTIEQVYWNHRTWPETNRGPKPPLSRVLPDAAIRAKVANYLKESNALAKTWQRPITEEQLQAEIDRMARSTRDPGVLREIFAALGNDPFLIAETLARQTLADRLIRDWYARDERFHGEVRRGAVAALQGLKGPKDLGTLGAQYLETTWRRQTDGDPLAAPKPGEIILDPSQWAAHLDGLAATFASVRPAGPRVAGETVHTPVARQADVPLLRLSRLQEEDGGYFVTVVLAQEPGTIRTATASWPKTPFETWWAGQARSTSAALAPAGSRYAVARVAAAAPCAPDSWKDSSLSVGRSLSPRHLHTSVWTGTEMIVWGGFDTGYTTTGARYNPSTNSWVAMSVLDAPAGRQDHTAVWTGTEMIVWGGIVGTVSGTGGRYDPATDHWVATSLTDAPSARSRHSAVWTGSEMIVWGGFDSTFLSVNSGSRYDPSTDHWVATSIDNAPSGRSSVPVVWTGSEMIVWGGADSTGGRYDPSTDHWVATSLVNAPLPCHAAVWTGSEMIVWDGRVPGGRYNPSTDTWAAMSMSHAPSSRLGGTAVWTGSEMIVWGGLDDATFGNTDTGARYDPSTDTWAATSIVNAPEPRADFTAVWTGSEMIVWGGIADDGYADHGGRYDPSTDSWVTLAQVNAPLARFGHTAVWTGTEMIVWSGYTGYISSHLPGTGGRYYPAIDEWVATTRTSAVTERTDHSAVWTGTDMIVWGGDNYDDTGFILAPVSTGGRYNPITDTWVATSVLSAASPRRNHTAVWTGSEMLVWGGYNDYLCFCPADAGGRYDPSTDQWATLSVVDAPSGRFGHTAVWTGTEMIVWGGGWFGGGSSTGGRYDPATDHWVPTSGVNAPAARTGHRSVWTGSEMIAWGGYDGGNGYFSTGGRYDPTTDQWTATSVSNAPTPRRGHTAVWTNGEVIVWGGYDGGGTDFATGGRYDPSTDQWTSTSVANAPSPRGDHTAVWTGSEMLVWGGSAGGVLLDDGGRYGDCPTGPCAVDNGGCDPRTTCTNVGGSPVCGHCPAGFFGSGSSGCAACSVCAPGQYIQTGCGGANDTLCAACPPGCLTCTGPMSCTSCAPGDFLGVDGICHVDLCVGVTCTASDQCHTVGTCDRLTGVCSNPNAPDGTTCADGDVCTVGETCRSGICMAPVSFIQAAGSPVGAGTTPRGVATGDWNGDGRLDLAVANFGSANVTILLGDGAGGFIPAAGSPVAVGPSPRAVTAGDWNGDGRLDLAVANFASTNVTILLGNGAGGFSPAAGSPVATGTSPASLTAGDWNGDGKLDLATADSGSNAITILLGDGAGGFSPAAGSPVPAGTSPFSIAAGDWNRDGTLDLAVANFGSGDLTILLGNGLGGFGPAAGSPIATGNSATFVAAGDWNRDGVPDLAVANFGSNDLTILIGDGSGRFVEPAGSPIAVGFSPQPVVVADWNLDGKLDLAVGDVSSSDVTILLGNGLGGFAAAAISPIALGGQPRGEAVGDWNGDGTPDLAVASAGSNDVTILLDVSNAAVCPASDQCHEAGTCNPGTGLCSNPVKPNGSACDDGNLCTLSDSCQSGTCAGGTPVTCADDGNACTDEVCHPATGCTSVPNSATVACYTGPAGTAGVGVCHAGVATCAGGFPGPCAGQVVPIGEICDGLDNNCDGRADEEFPGGCTCALPVPGLVSFWPGDGNARDIHGGHDGTIEGGATFAPGRVGQAFVFDGVDDTIDAIGTPSTYSFIQDTGVFTIIAWMRVDDPSALVQQAITGNTQTTVEKGHFFIWENLDGLSRMRVSLTNGTPGAPVVNSVSGPNAITTTGWHHVAAVGDGTHVTFYVDGVGTPGTGTIGTLSSGDSTHALALGTCGGACLFKGQLDEVQIYDRALGSSEILANYAAGGDGLCRCTDADGDGYGVEGGPLCPAGPQPDCDDANAAIHPGAPDVTCNGVDDNCNGQIDEGSPAVCQCLEPVTGLVSWWPGDGSALDIRGGHEGTLQGGVSFAAGEVGQAFQFDGVSGSVGNIGTPSTYSFIQDTGLFTVAAWIRVADPTAVVEQAITGNMSSGTERGHFFVWDNSDGLERLRVAVFGGNPGVPVIQSASAPNAITTGGWHHVAVVGDGTHVTFYVDGIGTIGAGTMGALGSGDSSHALSIGDCGPSGACLWKGAIDEVQIYSRALGAAAIRTIYETGGGGQCRCTDADGDGFGAQGGQSCARGTSQDCDDGNAAAWSQPIEVTNLRLGSGAATVLTWDSQAPVVGPGVTYDILRGSLDLPVGSAGEVCAGPGVSGTTDTITATPPLGTGFWYLVRSRNSCGVGTYGTRSNGAPRISPACP